MTAYTLGDVARICKVSTSRLRYWERTALLVASEQVDARPAYAFGDLLSVRSLVGLLERGVPLGRIRRSVEAVRKRVPDVDQPLRALRKRPDGSRGVVFRHGAQLLEADGQMLLDFCGNPEADEACGPLAHRTAEVWEAQALRFAEEWFERGCALDSDRATYAEAIEAYGKALELVPDFADALCNLGSVYFNQGRRTPARDCFERTLALVPRHLEANLNLATLAEEVGRDALALRHYKAALEADPLHADTHVSVALLYEKLRARQKSAEHWRRYLQLDPAGLWADIARRHLSK